MSDQLCDKGIDIVPDGFRAELFLASEVIVERTFRNIHCIQDFLQPRSMIALSHQHADPVQQIFSIEFLFGWLGRAINNTTGCLAMSGKKSAWLRSWLQSLD
jgi:hypothetical protein